MTWQTFAFLIVAGVAFGYSGYRFSILYRIMKNHQGRATERLNDLGARIQTALVNVLGQKAVLRKKSAGIMHATIFWGFLIITVGTLEQFVEHALQRSQLRIHRAYRLQRRSCSLRISSLSPCCLRSATPATAASSSAPWAWAGRATPTSF